MDVISTVETSFNKDRRTRFVPTGVSPRQRVRSVKPQSRLLTAYTRNVDITERYEALSQEEVACTHLPIRIASRSENPPMPS